MLVFICAFAGVAAAAGWVLVAMEWRRFRADRSPAPPLPPEESARDPWNARVADVIAALSIVAALAAWQAAVAYGTASDLANVALQQTAQYQAVRAVEDSRLVFGDRLTQLYQQHTVAESSLYAQAAAARQSGNPAQAAELEAEARVEGAQARVLAHGFIGYVPTDGANGSADFNRRQQLSIEQTGNQDLRTLDANHVALITSHADQVRHDGELLILASALLIAATLFLTVARLGWKHRRLFGAAPGTLFASAAAVVLVIAVVS